MCIYDEKEKVCIHHYKDCSVYKGTDEYICMNTYDSLKIIAISEICNTELQIVGLLDNSESLESTMISTTIINPTTPILKDSPITTSPLISTTILKKLQLQLVP